MAGEGGEGGSSVRGSLTRDEGRYTGHVERTTELMMSPGAKEIFELRFGASLRDIARPVADQFAAGLSARLSGEHRERRGRARCRYLSRVQVASVWTLPSLVWPAIAVAVFWGSIVCTGCIQCIQNGDTSACEYYASSAGTFSVRYPPEAAVFVLDKDVLFGKEDHGVAFRLDCDDRGVRFVLGAIVLPTPSGHPAEALVSEHLEQEFWLWLYPGWAPFPEENRQSLIVNGVEGWRLAAGGIGERTALAELIVEGVYLVNGSRIFVLDWSWGGPVHKMSDDMLVFGAALWTLFLESFRVERGSDA